MRNFIFALSLIILMGSGQFAWADTKSVQLSVPGCNS